MINRKKFKLKLKKVIYFSIFSFVLLLVYTFIEAKLCQVTRVSMKIDNLPEGFKNFRILILSDVHHGPFVPLIYIDYVVDMANTLKPDIVMLLGDYVHRDSKYIKPCINALGNIKSNYGTYAVLGNHDHWEGAGKVRAAFKQNNMIDLSNRGIWLKKGKSRIRIGEVGDLWEDVQDLEAAVGSAREKDVMILLSHNPDFAEQIKGKYVDLMLSGHTHGGQVVLPFIGAPIIPSRYGKKYLYGKIKTENCQIFVSRGVGTITPPVRFRCAPEIVLITLK